MNFLNYFLASKTFERLNSFIVKKIFKIFKVFFVKTEFDSLPVKNYTIKKEDVVSRLKESEKFKEKDLKPYITYNHLLDLITVMNRKENFNFFDYGAGNLDLFYYLNKNISNINYFFYDLKEVCELIKIYKENNNLKKINICDSIIKYNYDLVYFGSSLQYIKDYKEEILKFKNRTEYLLISQTPFFKKLNFIKENFIMKQVNMHPNINYLYAINLDIFKEFMEENNFKLVDKNLNKVTKFLNFKNFKNDRMDIDMYDLLFKKN